MTTAPPSYRRRRRVIGEDDVDDESAAANASPSSSSPPVPRLNMRLMHHTTRVLKTGHVVADAQYQWIAPSTTTATISTTTATRLQSSVLPFVQILRRLSRARQELAEAQDDKVELERERQPVGPELKSELQALETTVKQLEKTFVEWKEEAERHKKDVGKLVLELTKSPSKDVADALKYQIARSHYDTTFVNTYERLWAQDEVLLEANHAADMTQAAESARDAIQKQEDAFASETRAALASIQTKLGANADDRLRNLDTAVVRLIAERDALQLFIDGVLAPGDVQHVVERAENPILDSCNHDVSQPLTIPRLRMLLAKIPLYAWDTVVETHDLDALLSVQTELDADERDRLQRAVSHTTAFRRIGTKAQAREWYLPKGVENPTFHYVNAWSNVQPDPETETETRELQDTLQDYVNRHIAALHGLQALDSALEKEVFREHVYAIASAMLLGLEQLPLQTVQAWFACSPEDIVVTALQLLDRLIRNGTSESATGSVLTAGMIDFTMQPDLAARYAEESKAANTRVKVMGEAALEHVYRVWELALRKLAAGEPAAHVKDYVRRNLSGRDLYRLRGQLDVPERLTDFLLLSDPAYQNREQFVLSPTAPQAEVTAVLSERAQWEKQYRTLDHAAHQVWQDAVAIRSTPQWLVEAARQTADRFANPRRQSDEWALVPLLRALKSHEWGAVSRTFLEQTIGVRLSQEAVDRLKTLMQLPVEELARYDPEWLSAALNADRVTRAMEAAFVDENYVSLMRRRKREPRYVDVTVERAGKRRGNPRRFRERVDVKSELGAAMAKERTLAAQLVRKDRELKAAQVAQAKAAAKEQAIRERMAELELKRERLALAGRKEQKLMLIGGAGFAHDIALQTVLPPSPWSRFYQRVMRVAGADQMRALRRRQLKTRHCRK